MCLLYYSGPMPKTKLSKEELREQLYRRRYVVPNLVTIGSLFCGFLTIIYASSDRYEKAVLSIVIAILLDGLDGRVARRLNATSKFGVEFDSFADLVSFGVAPAMLMYHWCFRALADEFGVFICFVYVICAATRLAKFNLMDEDLSGFQGLPSPAAAAVVAAVVNLSPVLTPTAWLVVFGTGLMPLLAYLMVCNMRYLSIKQLKIRTMPGAVRILLGAFVALVWYRPYLGFIGIAAGYALSGPIMEWRRHLLKIDSSEEEDSDDESEATIQIVK